MTSPPQRAVRWFFTEGITQFMDSDRKNAGLPDVNISDLRMAGEKGEEAVFLGHQGPEPA